MEDITPWTLWNDLQANSHSRLSSGKLQSSNQSPVCLDVFTGMLCLCSIESNFQQLEQVLSRDLSAVSIPSRRRKGRFKASLISLVLIPRWDKFPNQHSWNTELSVPIWKMLPHQHCLGDSGQNSCGIFFRKSRAVHVAAMPRTMSPCWAQRGGRSWGREENPRHSRAALWLSAPSAIQFTSPGSVPAVFPGVTLGAVTNCRHCKRPRSVQEMQLFNEPCCHYSKMTQGLS